MAIGDIIVGVDFDSLLISTVIGKISKQNQIDIIGYGQSPNTAVKKGNVLDHERAAEDIKHSIAKAAEMAKVKISSAYITILGKNIELVSASSELEFNEEPRKIGYEEIDELLKQAQKDSIYQEKQVIDTIPHRYVVNKLDIVENPIGLEVNNIKLDADTILVSTNYMKDLIKVFKNTDLVLDNIIPKSLATAEIVLNKDEKSGVLMIDISNDTIDISLYENNRILLYDTILVGGENVIKDISIGLKVSEQEAQRLLRQYGLSSLSLIDNDVVIPVSHIGDIANTTIQLSELVEIIESRVYEMLYLVNEKLTSAKLKNKIKSGIVITGQGINHIYGIEKFAQTIFNLPTRVGTLKLIGTLNPTYATALGIIKYVSEIRYLRTVGSDVEPIRVENTNNVYNMYNHDLSIWDRIKLFFEKLFFS